MERKKWTGIAGGGGGGDAGRAASEEAQASRGSTAAALLKILSEVTMAREKRARRSAGVRLGDPDVAVMILERHEDCEEELGSSSNMM